MLLVQSGRAILGGVLGCCGGASLSRVHTVPPRRSERPDSVSLTCPRVRVSVRATVRAFAWLSFAHNLGPVASQAFIAILSARGSSAGRALLAANESVLCRREPQLTDRSYIGAITVGGFCEGISPAQRSPSHFDVTSRATSLAVRRPLAKLGRHPLLNLGAAQVGEAHPQERNVRA